MLQHVSMIAGCAIELQRPKMHGPWRLLLCLTCLACKFYRF